MIKTMVRIFEVLYLTVTVSVIGDLMDNLIGEYINNFNDAIHITKTTSVDQLASSIYNVRTYECDQYVSIAFPIGWCNLQFKFDSTNIWARFKWYENNWSAFKQIY